MAELALSSMVGLVEDLVSDTGNTHYSAAAYKRFVSDAWLAVSKIAPDVVEYEATTNSVAGQSIYTIPGFGKILHVDYDDKPMVPITALQLREWDQDWEQVDGTPQYYILGYDNLWGYPQTLSFEFDTFRLWPVPEEVKTIRVIGYKAPVELSDDADVIDFPKWAQEAVVYEAAARVLEARSELRNPDLAKGYRLIRDGYLQAVVNVYTNRMPNRVISVGGPDAAKRLTRETSINATGKAGAGS